ncbi:MAG: hypothetical protein AAGI38_24485, partial [Bacteroidota bacterium]
MKTKRWLLFPLFLGLHFLLVTPAFSQSGSSCSSSEGWVTTNFPPLDTIPGNNYYMAELNNNLYAVHQSNVGWPRKTTLYKFANNRWIQASIISNSFSRNSTATDMISFKGELYLSGRFDSSKVGTTNHLTGVIKWDSVNNEWLHIGVFPSTTSIGHDLEIYKGELILAGKFDSIGIN